MTKHHLMLDDRSELIGSDATPPGGQRRCGAKCSPSLLCRVSCQWLQCRCRVSLMCTVHEAGSYLSESSRGAPVTLDMLCFLLLLFTLCSFFILASLAPIGCNSVVSFFFSKVAGFWFPKLELSIRQSIQLNQNWHYLCQDTCKDVKKKHRHVYSTERFYWNSKLNTLIFIYSLHFTADCCCHGLRFRCVNRFWYMAAGFCWLDPGWGWCLESFANRTLQHFRLIQHHLIKYSLRPLNQTLSLNVTL